MWRLSTASSTAWPRASRAAAVATSTHMSSGSGAPSSPTASGCHVRLPTPMMHGLRGSIAPVNAERSLALPDRLAFLGEGLRALLRILGPEDRARKATLLLERRAALLAEQLRDLPRPPDRPSPPPP